MADEPSSPYRDAPKAELVVQAGESSSILVAIATLGVGLKACWWYFDLSTALGWLTAMAIGMALVPLLIWVQRRNRWRFTLERSTLRVERLLPAGARRIGVLDVHHGITVNVEVAEQIASEDARFTLSAQGEELSFVPRGKPRHVHSELTRFLREHDVEVDTTGKLPEAESLEFPKLPKP